MPGKPFYMPARVQMLDKSVSVCVILCLIATLLLGFVYLHLSRQVVFLDVGAPGDENYIHGFYMPEGDSNWTYRWSDRHPSFLFPNRGAIPYTISLAADAPRPEGHAQPQVSILLNGRESERLVIESGIREYSFRYTPVGWWPADLLVEIESPTFSPPGDPRELGLLVNGITLQPESDPTLTIDSLLAILFGVMPGVVLLLVSYFILRLARLPVWSSAVGFSLLLGLLAWGMSSDALSAGVVVNLCCIVVVVYMPLLLARKLGLLARLPARVATWLSHLGKSLGESWNSLSSGRFFCSLVRSTGCWIKAHRWDLLIAVALFALALLARLVYYVEMPHITDEFREVQIAAEVSEGTYYPLFFSTTDYLGIVHSYLLGLFLRVAGLSLFTPRLYVVLMGSLTVVLTYWLARELSSYAVSVIAALLMLTSPLHILIASHVAWMNSTTPGFCLLMFIAFYRGVRRDSDFCLAASGFFAGVALQTHPTVALLFPGMALWYGFQQRMKGRSFVQCLKRPALYIAAALFVLGYGNIIWHNSHGRLYALAAAQRRDSISRNPLEFGVYLQALGDMLQCLLSSLSGDFRFKLTADMALYPLKLIYGFWLLGGLLYAGVRRKMSFVLIFLPVLVLFPLVNQNWSIPDRSRYLFYFFPLGYVAMASLAVDLWAWGKPKLGLPANKSLSFSLEGLAILTCAALVLYPVFPLWRFYQTSFESSEWSNFSILRATEALREYRERSVPIYLDAALRHSDLPIVGTDLLKNLEYLLFLDKTECEVISFKQIDKPPRTFNHDVKYVSPSDAVGPSVWVLYRATWNTLSTQYDLPWSELPVPETKDERFGLYWLNTSGN